MNYFQNKENTHKYEIRSNPTQSVFLYGKWFFERVQTVLTFGWVN